MVVVKPGREGSKVEEKDYIENTTLAKVIQSTCGAADLKVIGQADVLVRKGCNAFSVCHFRW